MKRLEQGFALPAVLALVVLIIPMVFAFALRSHQQLEWYAKLLDQKKAILYAEEAEALARAELRAGGTGTAGGRPILDGAAQWRVVRQADGDDGQKVAVVFGEGVHLGEERLLMVVVEVFGAVPSTVLVGRDRAFVLNDEQGGRLADLPRLVALHQASVSRYLDNLATENRMSPGQFDTRLHDQSFDLPCPDIRRDWAGISAALARAKCAVN